MLSVFINLLTEAEHNVTEKWFNVSEKKNLLPKLENKYVNVPL